MRNIRRTHVILLIAAVIFLGSIVAWSATRAERDYTLRGFVDPTQTTDLPYRIPRLGVNADLTQYDDPAAELARMREGGVTWVRQRVFWDYTERVRNEFNWSGWDQLADAFRAQPDLEWVVVFVNSPIWATSDFQLNAPPDDPADLAAFAAAFATRYSDVVDYYQVWDEPNITTGWGNREPRPAEYIALLSAAYRAIHAADPVATVIAAALAPTTEQTVLNISDILYFRALYALGLSDVMDAAAAKPYGFDLPAEDRTVDANVLNFSRLIALREIMAANGDSDKMLWASEWGWNALPPDWTGAASIWGSVTEDEQIAYTLAALDRADREWAWLGGMILESWQPNAQPDNPRWGFALIDANDQTTPLWQALVSRPPAPMHGIYFPTHPNAHYSGVWTFGELGADIGWVQDSQFTFDFIGTDISLLLRRDNYLAFLYPTIDDQPTNATPKDTDGNPFIALRSDDLEAHLELIPVARSLAPGSHTLRVVADRGWDRWALAGFAVRSGDPAAAYERQLSVAALSAILSFATIIVSAAQIDWRPLARRANVIWERLSDVGQYGISAITSIALMIGMILTWRDPAPSIFSRDIGILTPAQFGFAFITAGLIYIQPHIVIVIAAALILFWILYNRPDIGLMLTLFYAPFFLFPVKLYLFAFPMPELVLLITTAAVILRGLGAWGQWRQQTNRLIPPIRLIALDWGVVIWLIVGVVSLSWAEYRAPAITELRVMLIEPALFYLIYKTLPRESRLDLRLVDTLIMAGAVMAAISLVMFVRGDGIITAEGGAGRLAGVYGSPNNVGLFLGRCIPFALAFALIRTDRNRRIAAIVALIPMALALILSQSAGALFVGVPVAVAAVLVLIYGRRALIPLVGLGGVGAVGLIIAMQSARFQRLLDFAQGTTFFRIRVWASAWQALQDRPLTGLGLDQFLYAFQGRYMMPDAWQEPNLSHPHNVILDIWTRLGVAGLIAFAWIQFAFWRAMSRAYRAFRAEPLRFALIVGVMGCMVNILAHGMVDNSVFVVDLALIFGFLLGIAARVQNWGHDSSREVR